MDRLSNDHSKDRTSHMSTILSNRNNTQPIPIKINPSMVREKKSPSTSERQKAEPQTKSIIIDFDHYNTIAQTYGTHEQKKTVKRLLKKIAGKNSLKIDDVEPLICTIVDIFVKHCQSLYKDPNDDGKIEYANSALKTFENRIINTLENFNNPKLVLDVAALYQEISKNAKQFEPFYRILTESKRLIGSTYIHKMIKKACSAQQSITLPSKLTLGEMGNQINYFILNLVKENKKLIKETKIFESKDLNLLWIFDEFELENLGYTSNQYQAEEEMFEITNTTPIHSVRIHRKNEIESAAKNLLQKVELWKQKNIHNKK